MIKIFVLKVSNIRTSLPVNVLFVLPGVSFLCLYYRFCIQFFFQFARPFEYNDFSGCQNQIFSGGQVPALSFLFVFHAEFTEAGDHKVIAGLQF